MALRRLLLAVAVCAPGALAQTAADFFDNTVLHELRISLKAADWQSLKDHYLENTYYNVDSLTWKGGGSNTATVNTFQMRSRGHGSRSPIKPGLHVDFNRINANQRFVGLTQVELKSNSQDPSLVHELISFELFARMGVPVSRVAPAKVFVNGEYIGLYNMCETPSDPVYLQRLFNDTGGYVFEYKPGDWLTPNVPGTGYRFEYLGSDLDKYASSTAATPFNPENHTNAPDTVTLEKFIRTINQASDGDFIAALTAEPGAGPLIDPKQFLTQVAAETYLADFDCILGDIFGLNNFYLYRNSKSQFLSFMGWDKDNAFDWTQRPILQNADKNVLMRRLVAIPEYKSFYFDALAKAAMLAGGSGGWIQSETNRFYTLIKQAAYDDVNKTYLDSGLLVPSSNDKFEASVALVRSFAGDRTDFVTKDLVRNGYQPPGFYPTLADGGVVNAAAFASPAAGAYAAIFGANFGDVKNTTAYVNGFLAPLSFASSGQINVQVPWEAAGFAPFGVIANGNPSNIQFATVQTYSPGVFVVTHSDGFTPITDSNPAKVGETVVVYANGMGPVNGPMVTGQAASTTTLASTTTSPTVTINSTPASVVFSGLSPGLVGCYQLNVTIPAGVSGTASLSITIGGVTGPPAPFVVR